MRRTFDINVAGVTFRKANVKEFLDGRKRDIKFVKEPDNKYDPNAIMIMGDGLHIGYVPKTINQQVAMLMDMYEHKVTYKDGGEFTPSDKKKPILFVKLEFAFEDGEEDE